MILEMNDLVIQEAVKPDRLNIVVGLLFGFCLLALGVYGAFTGRAWNSIYGWFYRTKNPVIYWLEIFGFFVAAGWLFWHFLPFVFWS